jgi:flagellar biosynthesis protein FlhB
MFMYSKKNLKALTALATSIFLMAGIFGLSHAGMTMEPDGSMSGCPFMGATAVCNMSPLEHVAAWQSMFTATTSENTLAALLFLILAAISVVLVLGEHIFPEVRGPLFYRPPRFSFFRHSLQEAFSNGILNSRAY